MFGLALGPRGEMRTRPARGRSALGAAGPFEQTVQPGTVALAVNWGAIVRLFRTTTGPPTDSLHMLPPSL